MLVKFSPTQVDQAAMFVKTHNHYQRKRSLDDIVREIYNGIRQIAESYISNDDDYLCSLSTSGWHIQVGDVTCEGGKFIKIEVDVLVDPAVSVECDYDSVECIYNV